MLFSPGRVEIVRDGHNIVLRPLASTVAEALMDLPALSEPEAQALATAMAQLDDLPALDEPESATPPQAQKRKRERA